MILVASSSAYLFASNEECAYRFGRSFRRVVFRIRRASHGWNQMHIRVACTRPRLH